MQRLLLASILTFAVVLFILDTDVSGRFGRLRELSVDGGDIVAKDKKICITPELDGEWVADEPSTDLTLLEARLDGYFSCENFTDGFRWKTDALVGWNASDFCRILGNRTIAVIGDSTMRQSARVLTDMVSPAGCDKQIYFLMADTLVFEGMGGLNRGAYWTTHVKKRHPDIVVISAGAHIMDEANFTRVFDAAMADIEEMKKERPGIQFVWKTQNPAGGRPSREASYNQKLPGHPAEAGARRASDPMYKLWNHHTFWGRDNTILPQLQKRGVPFLDMRMLYNRVDAHPWQTGDCLHFCLPGPLRIFPVLLQRLMEKDFEVSKCIEMR